MFLIFQRKHLESFIFFFVFHFLCLVDIFIFFFFFYWLLKYQNERFYLYCLPHFMRVLKGTNATFCTRFLYYLDDPFHLCLPLLLNRFYNEEHWILFNVKKINAFLVSFLLVFMFDFLSLCSWGMLVYIFSLNNVPCF